MHRMHTDFRRKKYQMDRLNRFPFRRILYLYTMKLSIRMTIVWYHHLVPLSRVLLLSV